MNLSMLMSYVGLTLREPREMARVIMALDWPRQMRWEALVLVSVLAVIAAQVLQIVTGTVAMMSFLGFDVTAAVGLGLIQLFVMSLGAYAATWLGRLAGGQGRLDDAILLLAWLQTVLLVFQIVQIALIFLIPFLSGPIGMLAFVLSFWLLTVFVAEMHDFRSLPLVFLSILATLVLIGLIVSMVLGVLGMQIMMGTT